MGSGGNGWKTAQITSGLSLGEVRSSTFILSLEYDYQILVLPEVLFVCLFFVVFVCLCVVVVTYLGEFHWSLLHNYPLQN